MIKITPILVGFPTQEEATDFNLIPIIYSTTATSCNTRWQLFKQTERTITTPETEDIVAYSYNLLAEGNHHINEEEYSAWGADNAYLEDLVLTALNLTRL